MNVLDLSDGANGPWEWAYQTGIWGVGVGLLTMAGVIAYRMLFMDRWSARWDYNALHSMLGAMCSVAAVTCFWPDLRQTFIFTMVRSLLFIFTACYLSVTHREGMPFHVPGYQRKPREPEHQSPIETARDSTFNTAHGNGN